jgi:hypothetical protein
MVSLQMLPCTQLIFSFQNLVFWNLFEFSAAEITLKNQYLPHSESKSYQMNSPLNPAHQDLSNNTKSTFQFLQYFQGRSHSIFKNFYTASPNAMKPSQCTLLPRELWKESQRVFEQRALSRTKSLKEECGF